MAPKVKKEAESPKISTINAEPSEYDIEDDFPELVSSSPSTQAVISINIS